jgi:glycosyltransferase involved in cell wall biosynthesis
MRILHVIPSLAARDGGPPKAVIEMCRELLRRGEHAEIYTTNADGDGSLDVPVGRPIEVRDVKVTYFPVNGSHYYKFSVPIAAALRTNVPRYDVVHINSLYQFPSTIAAYYCRKYGFPYILTPHGSLDPYIYWHHPLRKRLYEVLVERRNLAAAKAVHFTSAEEMELASSLGLRFRGVVGPYGLEIDESPPDCWTDAEAEWPELVGKKVLLFLGRINFKKGLDVMARAFGAVHRRRGDAHLVIAGPDTDGYAGEVRKWLDDEGALDAATFAGMVVDGRKAALFRRADLFVLPSYSENFGIAVVEAMAAGLPIVISNKVNIWREIDEAGAGVVVKPDAEEVAGAILVLLDDPLRAKQMGERGRRLALEKFSWKAAGDHLVRLYQGVVAGRSPAPTTGMPSPPAG